MNFRKANINHEGDSTLEEIFLLLKQLKSTVQVKTVETEEMLNQKSLLQFQFRLLLEQISNIQSRVSAIDKILDSNRETEFGSFFPKRMDQTGQHNTTHNEIERQWQIEERKCMRGANGESREHLRQNEESDEEDRLYVK